MFGFCFSAKQNRKAIHSTTYPIRPIYLQWEYLCIQCRLNNFQSKSYSIFHLGAIASFMYLQKYWYRMRIESDWNNWNYPNSSTKLNLVSDVIVYKILIIFHRGIIRSCWECHAGYFDKTKMCISLSTKCCQLVSTSSTQCASTIVGMRLE